MRRSSIEAVLLPVSTKKTNKSKMTKKNSQSCQYASKKIKITELSLKNRLHFLQSAIDQRKSFRSLTLLINKAKANVDELKTRLDAVLKKSELEQHFICHGAILKPSVTSREV